MATPQSANTPISTRSDIERDNMPELQTFTQLVRDLSDSVGNWSIAGHWFAGIAAIATVLLFIASVVVFSKTSELTKAQDALAAAKDRELQLALKDKDVKIGEANATAEAAKESTERLASENLTLRGQVATLETAASDALARQQKIETDLLAQQERLEEAHAKNIAALTTAHEADVFAQHGLFLLRREATGFFGPRELNPNRIGEYAMKLRMFSGTKFSVVTLPETEPARLGSAIARLLVASDWEETEPIRKVEESGGVWFPDGVAIEYQGKRMDNPLVPAMDALRDMLHDSDIQCSQPPPTTGPLPEGVLRIAVGLRPTHPKRWPEADPDGELQRMYDRSLRQEAGRRAVPKDEGGSADDPSREPPKE